MNNITSAIKAIKEQKDSTNWKAGDTIKLTKTTFLYGIMAAEKGATATIMSTISSQNPNLIVVQWLDKLSHGQLNGKYDKKRFIKI